VFFLRILLADKLFWINSLSIWGAVWSVVEGGLFALQLAGIATNLTLGYIILILLALSLVIGGYINWPLRELDATLLMSGVKIRLRFGDFWKQNGEKIVGVTRCFSSTVDDVIIHSSTLHGSFIKRNFVNNYEARIRIATELGICADGAILQDAGKTIKLTGSKDTAYLVGITTLDSNNQASVKLNDYFVALGSMWEFIRQRNGGEEVICPLLGAGRARLNHNSSAIFCELLNSALIAMKSGFITTDLIFVVQPSDIQKGYVDLDEIKSTFNTLCAYENLNRIIVEGHAEEIDV
jgi:hypothetical protein